MVKTRDVPPPTLLSRAILYQLNIIPGHVSYSRPLASEQSCPLKLPLVCHDRQQHHATPASRQRLQRYGVCVHLATTSRFLLWPPTLQYDPRNDLNVIPSKTNQLLHSATDGDGSEQVKVRRREMANSNERKRMQQINKGFEDLQAMVPACTSKMSKVR